MNWQAIYQPTKIAVSVEGPGTLGNNFMADFLVYFMIYIILNYIINSLKIFLAI